MGLKEYIKCVLTDIVNSVDECQMQFGNKATVLPYRASEDIDMDEIDTDKGYAYISKIDFDVALTSSLTKSDDNTIDGGIHVAGLFNIKGKKGADATELSQCVSRVRFSLPVVLPHVSLPNERKYNIGKHTAASCI